MKIVLNKAVYRTLVIVSFLAVNAFILFGISTVMAYMNSGADRSQMFSINYSRYLPPPIPVEMDFSEVRGGELDEQGVAKIKNDYLKAWELRENNLRYNTNVGAGTYFTDSARCKFDRIIESNIENNTWGNSVNINHDLDFQFVSADGKLVVFEDHSVEQLSIYYKDDKYVGTQKKVVDYTIMMMLEDGFWRIRHLELDKIKPRKTYYPIGLSKEQEHKIKNIKGINYYPQASPWSMFGENFDAEVVASDFEKMEHLGLNTIRVFIQYEDFGKEFVQEDKLLQFDSLMDIASTHNLDVIVTLFDFYGNYDVSDIPATRAHAKIIVNRYKNHEALLAWDIKNEPDLDFESRGSINVLFWLEEMIHLIREESPENLVTIGWSSTDDGKHLAQYLDFVSFHYYLDQSMFTNHVDVLQNIVPDKILVLQEYGFSSYRGIWNFFRGSEEEQADYYRVMHQQIEKINMPYVFWTLYDFTSVPNSVVGMKPWRKERQKFFGVIGADSLLKPAYHAIFPEDSVSDPSLDFEEENLVL